MKTVIVVDEDSSARAHLIDGLGRRGLLVFAAVTEDEAFREIERRQPDLIISELRLPGGSGLRLLDRVRSCSADSRFLVLTAYGSVASAVRATRLGAVNYVCKPASIDTLMAAAWPERHGGAFGEAPGLPLTLDEAIWEHIHQTIDRAGSISEAARQLGLWRQSLKRMIAKYRPQPDLPGEDLPREARLRGLRATDSAGHRKRNAG